MWAYDPNDESTWEMEDHMRLWEAQQAAKAKPPEADPWGRPVQVFAGASPVGDYDSCQLWLAKEWAQDVARDYPGEIVWVLDEGSVSETYRFDPEDGMETGVAQ